MTVYEMPSNEAKTLLVVCLDAWSESPSISTYSWHPPCRLCYAALSWVIIPARRDTDRCHQERHELGPARHVLRVAGALGRVGLGAGLRGDRIGAE